MNKRQKKQLRRIIVALVLFVIVFIIDKAVGLSLIFNSPFNWLFPFLIYLLIYIIIGYDVVFKAIRNIFRGHLLDENFLMCLATFGAFGLAIYRGVNNLEVEGFDEACAVLLFYQIGEFFQNYAVNKSRKSIARLMDIRPDYANVKVNEKFKKVDPNEVKIGDVILVNPGEKIPLDGVIIKGSSDLDMKSLTGESLPKYVNVNDEVTSGSINLSEQIEIEVQKEFHDSTVSKILELVENASSKKSKAENFISKFARIYTPVVISLALILMLIPSLITGNWNIWIYRSLNFLVVSCPCALVISIPLSFFSGLGAASKYGVLIKGSNYLEQFSKANIFLFDKTGTLTKGNFKITKIIPENKKEEILSLAALAEKDSSHPIALSIKETYSKAIKEGYTLKNLAGLGVVAENYEEQILCGNERLMQKFKINYLKSNEDGTIIYVAKNQEFKGTIIINDEIKDDSFEVLTSLKQDKAKLVMLTGDNEKTASNVAEKLCLDQYKCNLLPQNKVVEVENIMNRKNKNDVVCFVGDGINDAPSLMRADIGIAMGGVGSDAAIEASDIVLMQDNLKGLITAKKITHKTMRIVKENIVIAITIKIAILILSAFGVTNMWFAIFGDVGVAILAILNAIRVNSKY